MIKVYTREGGCHHFSRIHKLYIALLHPLSQPLRSSPPLPPWLSISAPTDKSHTTLSLHTAGTPLTWNYLQSSNSYFSLTFRTPKSFNDLHTLTENFNIPLTKSSFYRCSNGFNLSPTPNIGTFSQHNVQCSLESLYHKDSYTFKYTQGQQLQPTHSFTYTPI